MSKPKYKFSYYEGGINKTKPVDTINIQEFIEAIKQKDKLIDLIRKEPDKPKRDLLKRDLEYVTFAGIFKKRGNDYLLESSGFACLDIDDIEDIDEVRKQVQKDNYTHLLFTSPSGKGFKLVVKIPIVKDNLEYLQYWNSIKKYYGIKANDESAKDIARACYLSYDPEPYFNPDSKVYTDKEDSEAPTEIKEVGSDTSRSAKEYQEVCRLISQGKSKEEVYFEMQAFAKWSSAPSQYREKTYDKAKAFIDSKKQESKQYSKNWFLGQGKFGSYVKIDLVVDEIRKQYSFVTIFGKKTEEIWSYDEGIYKLNGREIIQTEVEELLGSYAKTKVVNEILNKIKRQTAISREEFDNIPKELLPLNNGVLNFETDEFLEYSPQFYFKTKLNVAYDPEAKCPKWFEFVEQTFYEEDIPLIQEWFGFCLYRDYFIKKGLIGKGQGDTGKSVVQNVIMRFFGEKNISGLNLQKIVLDNNFSKSTLYNKYVNLYDDMSSKDINEGGGFKMVTGRSPITAEYKFGDEFQFINFAKMTFCCNKIPPIKDTDDITYYNRWLPVAFDNVVPEDEQDKFLIDKLTKPEELSGLLNWALEGLKRLLKNGRFSYNKTPEETKAIMERSSHPLAEFVQDCLEEAQNGKITKEDMFQFYCLWARQRDRQRLSKTKLGHDLPKYAKFIMAYRGKERYWGNVKFKGGDDTYDTFIKNKGRQGYISGFDKVSKNASYMSEEDNDTYDALLEKEKILKEVGYLIHPELKSEVEKIK